MSLIETTLKKWDRAAIVRSRPRRLLNEQDSQSTLFFPLERAAGVDRPDRKSVV